MSTPARRCLSVSSERVEDPAASVAPARQPAEAPERTRPRGSGYGSSADVVDRAPDRTESGGAGTLATGAVGSCRCRLATRMPPLGSSHR
jgi:hypothetical protein